MTRAEEAALKAYPRFLEYYPHVPSSTCGPDGFTPTVKDHNAFGRQLFQEGYEQAEKELALTIEDIERIDIFLCGIRANKSGAFTFRKLDDEQYQEALRRFNEHKK